GPEEQAMTDISISHSRPVNNAGKIAEGFSRLIALFRVASGAMAKATARNAERRAMRRAPEEILAAQARREEARRTVDRLLQRR
ncbi:MAG: hypothetical protein ACRCUE_10585, partial [Bosea sp. (in: a-proteobacteria)]